VPINPDVAKLPSLKISERGPEGESTTGDFYTWFMD